MGATVAQDDVDALFSEGALQLRGVSRNLHAPVPDDTRYVDKKINVPTPTRIIHTRSEKIHDGRLTKVLPGEIADYGQLTSGEAHGRFSTPSLDTGLCP